MGSTILMKDKTVEKKIIDCFEEIKSVETTLSTFKPLAKEREYLTKYILIYTSGVLEISYKTLISNYCSFHSNSNLHNFFESLILKKSKNATYSNICELLKNINPDLHTLFKDKLNLINNCSEIKSSLESLSTLRHSFAHGNLSEKVYFSDIKRYFKNSVEIIKILDEILIIPKKHFE